MIVTLLLAAALSAAGAEHARPTITPIAPLAPATAFVPHNQQPKLRDSLDVALYARILKSADQRVLDTALLSAALGSRDVEMRRVAARTLSQVALRNRSDALQMLRALTRDRDSAVAGSALFGLGLIRDTSSISLIASIVRDDGIAAASAAWALGEIGKPAADAVANLLGGARVTSKSGIAVTRELLIAASKIRPLNFAAVKPYLASGSPELRWAAAYAVGRQRDRSAVASLLGAKAPDAKFRAELARVLTKSLAGDSLRDRALARLRVLVADANPYVRINALHAIGSYGDTARVAILHALHDRDANVRVAAAQSSATAFDTVTSAWRDAWRADTSYKVRRSLLEAAASRGVDVPGEALWRVSPDWRLRAAVAGAWDGSPDTAHARSVALGAVRDTDSRVRLAALNALIATDTARRDSVVQRALDAARTDPDSMVRNVTRVSHSRAANLDTTVVERPLEWYEDAVRRIVIPSLRGHPPGAVMRTARGQIGITFDGVLAPLTVLNFATLANKHAYDHLRFHRVVPAFVAQDGDPRGDGEGGPGYAIRDELTLLPYRRGAVGMALSGPDTGGSQYFLTLTPQPHLTGHYTVFGLVTSGLGAMDALVEGDGINSIRIIW